MQIIFTKHAQERILSRNIDKNLVEKTITSYDRVGKSKDTEEYYKKFGIYEYKVIAKRDEDKVVVISVWVDPPLPGSFDLIKKERYKKYLKASLSQKIWMQIKRGVLGWEF